MHMHKNALFLLKNCKNRPALGTSSTEPLTSGDGGIYLQTPSLWRLGAPPPGPRNPPHGEFLDTPLFLSLFTLLKDWRQKLYDLIQGRI